MARTPILVMCSLLPWSWKYDIGYKSWHTLWSWSTYVENIIYIQYGVKELCSGQDMNMHTVRRTGRQTGIQSGWFLYYSMNFVYGWYNFQTYMYQTKCLVRYRKHCFKNIFHYFRISSLICSHLHSILKISSNESRIHLIIRRYPKIFVDIFY